MELINSLQSHFGFTSFRPGQAEAIQSLLDAGICPGPSGDARREPVVTAERWGGIPSSLP